MTKYFQTVNCNAASSSTQTGSFPLGILFIQIILFLSPKSLQYIPFIRTRSQELKIYNAKLQPTWQDVVHLYNISLMEH